MANAVRQPSKKTNVAMTTTITALATGTEVTAAANREISTSTRTATKRPVASAWIQLSRR